MAQHWVILLVLEQCDYGNEYFSNDDSEKEIDKSESDSSDSSDSERDLSSSDSVSSSPYNK